MIFNEHSRLVGQHAQFSASKYHWINYDAEKMRRTFINALQAKRGDEEHEFAKNAIRLGIKLKSTPKTLNMYVNDAIGYRMRPEQPLFYSDNFFGTTDAIVFARNKLRIHDLKTGVTPTSEHQLEIYAALFCLEYGYKPAEIEIELRIYQNDEVRIYDGDFDIITRIMDKIVMFDPILDALRMEVGL